MPERKPLLLRLDPATLDALRSWAADDLRSLNGQIEFVLRRALREAGRLQAPRPSAEEGAQPVDDRPADHDALPDRLPAGTVPREGRARARRDRTPAVTEER